MSKKSMGLSGAHDYGARQKANAASQMPEVVSLSGGKASKPRAIPPQLGAGALPSEGKKKPAMQAPTLPASAGAPMKKGGKACYAAGGAAKIQHAQANKAGKPIPPKVRFHGKSGIGSK